MTAQSSSNLHPGGAGADTVIAEGQSTTSAAGNGVHGFAPALTRFVGRAAVVDEVTGLLEEHRLVTVTGPGGSGKTRLAAEVAGRMAGRFADGVWLVELAAVRDPAQVPLVAAVALGVRERPGEAAAGAVARVPARQQVLLVLDNCEHMIDAAAALCAELLLAADDVRVLATSREPLRVPGEVRYRLAPLTVPDPDDLSDVDGSEAVQLFADRALSADAHFVLDHQTGPAVARLVARLDGMPLAIELAAARVEALGLAQLLACLDDRSDLLIAGDRLADSRHQSLAATMQWSYQLLDGREQQVFRAVSVFPGPFTLGAAEAVAGEGAWSAVLRLVDCSLLAPPRIDPDGRARYVMLETLRACGAGLLARAGEQEQAAAAMAGHALQVAEQAAAALQTGTGELAAARWLDAEDATMRQVLAWAMERDEAVALRLAAALAPWWFLRGRSPDGYPLLREAAGPAAPGSRGLTGPPAETCRRQEPLDQARQVLGNTRARAGQDRGAAMSLAAAEYALTLTAPVPQPPELTPELARLSPRERELVTLIAHGRTDAQIAAHLFISVRTVASHLDRIRDKTGCRRRADLTRLALTAGLA